MNEWVGENRGKRVFLLISRLGFVPYSTYKQTAGPKEKTKNYALKRSVDKGWFCASSKVEM
jgi:hypothetical protein